MSDSAEPGLSSLSSSSPSSSEFEVVWDVREVGAYVMQDDVFLGNLTVRETLEYSLRLRVRGLGSEERSSRIEELISRLNLSKVANRKVGTPLKRGVWTHTHTHTSSLIRHKMGEKKEEKNLHSH